MRSFERLPFAFRASLAVGTLVGATLFRVAAASAAAPPLLADEAAARPAASPGSTPPRTYAIVVGSNAAGAGQQPLRFAEEDARRVASALREVGRIDPAEVRVLVHPDANAIVAAIDDASARITAARQRGEGAVLVFYYSGHARTSAFDLGSDRLPVNALRDRLRAVPATLTLVVLDACQSGQFARAKGAEPAADFSFQSVTGLSTKGVAVMASSSAQELSQESDELHGSYFTHHLLTGLRGAADVDHDGRVSLDEAYKYAYRRTLVTTAATQIGTQHVVLDTDLAGQGDVPLTYPAEARSQLEIPSALTAKVLVQHRASGAVLAELQKAPGSPVRLALAAGGYDVIVRPDRGVVRCRLNLVDDRVTTLDTGACEPVQEPAPTAAKGEADRATSEEEHALRHPIDPLSIEATVGPMWRAYDAYTARLNEFGYRVDGNLLDVRPRFRASLGVFKGVAPHVAIGGQVHTLAGDAFHRDLGYSKDTFTFDAYATTAYVRVSSSPLNHRTHDGGYAALYAQAGVGLALGTTTLTTANTVGGTPGTTHETYAGYVASGAMGIAVHSSKLVGAFLQGGYDYAPVIHNEMGETHNAGGPNAQLGLTFRIR